MDADRKVKLHALAGFRDVALDNYGTDTAVEATRQARAIETELGEFTDEDLAVLDERKRTYAREA